MKPEMDQVEVERLEQRIRRSAAGHRPSAPNSLVDFIETVPTRHKAGRWLGLALGGPRLQRSFSVVAAAAAIVIAIVGSATFVSIRNGQPGRSEAPATMAASYEPSATASSSPLALPTTTFADPSNWPSATASASASASATAHQAPTKSPTIPPGESPGASALPSYDTPVAISGRVTLKTTGEPLSSIAVAATELGGNNASFSTNTNANGQFSIPVEANLSYVIYVMDNFGSWTVPSGWYGPGGFTYFSDQATVVPVGSTDVTGIQVIMPPSAWLRGTVTNTDGTPLPGISVHLAGNTPSVFVTDSLGQYSGTVIPGQYTLGFQDKTRTYAPVWYGGSGVTYDQSAAASITIGDAGLTVNVALPRSVHIRGKVVNAGGAFTVTVAPQSGGWAIVSSNPDGTYSIEVRPGTYKVGVTVGGHTYWYSTSGCKLDAAAATVVAVSSGDVTGIDIDVGAGCT